MTGGVGAWQQPKVYRRAMTERDQPRVHLAVIGIQRDLIATGHLDADPSKLVGGFGPLTEAAVKAFQKANGLTVDGVYGRASSKAMWSRFFDWWQSSMGIPDNWLMGMATHESALDPGAQGSYDGRDRGILQYNSFYQPEVTDQLAYGDPPWCIQRAAGQLVAAYKRLGTWECAVANHNNPAKAVAWSRAGTPPDDQIAGYVSSVRAAAQ